MILCCAVNPAKLSTSACAALPGHQHPNISQELQDWQVHVASAVCKIAQYKANGTSVLTPAWKHCPQMPWPLTRRHVCKVFCLCFACVCILT